MITVSPNLLLLLKVVFMRPEDTFDKEAEQARLLLNKSMAEKALAVTNVLFTKTNP